MTQHPSTKTHCHYHWLAVIKCLLTAAFILALFQATVHAAPVLLQGRIVRVTDGDTVTLLDAHQILHKIRLAGIDAPESKMPFGHQATVFLSGLILGKDVDAHAYKHDRYGRTIATLFVENKDINLVMIQAGLAWHYKRYAREQPAGEARVYAQAEELARAQLLALWLEGIPIAPWEWRASHGRTRKGIEGAIMPAARTTSAHTNP
jgi:endonuclease YncB( thermonuclease family)